jgi:Skp family chaperone for outer membrane proteins
MMRLLLLATVAFGTLIFSSVGGGAAEPAAATPAALPAIRGKVAFVDMEKVFQGYYETTRSDAAFKKQKDLYSQHAKTQADEIEALKKQRDDVVERSLNIALSDEVRAQSRRDAEEKENLVREKDRQLREFIGGKDKELGRKYLELRNDIVKKLSDFIRAYAERNQYEMVLDSSGLTRNFIPAVVYYPKSQELTETILAELNRGHENEIPKETSLAKPEELTPDVPTVGIELPKLKE